MFTFINMPSYLSARSFNDWHYRMNETTRNIGLPVPVSDDLTVSFSDEEKTRAFGSSSIETAKKEIRSKWTLNDEANAILEQITGSNLQPVSVLAELICACNRNASYATVRTQLEEILNDIAFQERVLGEYIYPNWIVLYTKNIESTQDHPTENRTLLQVFEEVFAHEMFHAYHYQCDLDELTQRLDYTSRVVKESLAAAFEWHYCVENKIPDADNLRYAWDAHPVTVYPYSGATKLLQPVAHKAMVCLNKTAFCNVFKTSLHDMDGALRTLLEPDDFYKIKNRIYTRTKVITVPVAALTFDEFEALYSTKKVGQIAREEIPAIVLKKTHLAKDLLDDVYSCTTFGTCAAVVSATQKCYPGGSRMYYAKTKVDVNGKKYYLFMQWREKHRRKLLQWLWANKL